MKKCTKCGEVLEDSGTYDYEGIGIEEVKDYCFTCDFWANQAQLHRKEPNKRFMIKGVSYSIGPEDAGAMRGHGGCKFSILYKGEIIETTNMWCQGRVPEHFGAELPDTAELVPNMVSKPRLLPDDIPF